jgi:hypothetical protein
MYSVKLLHPYILRQHSMDNHRGAFYAYSRGWFLFSIPTRTGCNDDIELNYVAKDAT